MTEPDNNQAPQAQGLALDALLPAEMAVKAEGAGVRKAGQPALTLFMLAVLAGAFIALGAVFSTAVSAGAAGGSLPAGVVRLIAGVAFSLGLILVVVGGAELFTGNNLIVMAWASKKVTTGALLRNWGIVYAGNFAGGLATAVLVVMSGHLLMQGGSPGAGLLMLAKHKCSLEFWPALWLGVLCNALVCLAVWMCMSARSVTDKVLVIVPPVAAFVVAGFEHCVANMYYIPCAVMFRDSAPESFWQQTGLVASDFASVNWQQMLKANLLPVTIGNIIGGSVLVAGVYWAVYLRGRK